MMLKAFAKLPITKSIDILKSKKAVEHVFKTNNSFSTNKPTESARSQSKTDHSVHRKAFEGLKTQINCEKTQENIGKYTTGNTMDGIKQKLYENFRFRKETHQTSEQKQSDQPNIQSPYEALNQEIKHDQQEKLNVKESYKVEKAHESMEKNNHKSGPVLNFTESFTLNSKSIFGSVSRFVTESFEETFPADNFYKKTEQMKRKAREAAKIEREQQKLEFTEEELEKMQGTIPEWKRTAIATIQGDAVNDASIKTRIFNVVKNKVNETQTAKSFYSSESYQELQAVRKELHQFREDFKDHISHSQNPAVVASMTIFSKVTSESNTARAIQEMRKFVPRFSVYELEKDAKGVFCQIYDAFLEGNIEFIEKTCGGSALVYFRTLLKKREVDNVCPKYNYIWESEPADLIGGQVSAELNRPCFTFTIRIQEIHCNVCRKNNKIVDGGEDRVQQNRFNFVLTLHENPDLEEAGHSWELVEILPVEAVQMLA